MDSSFELKKRQIMTPAFSRFYASHNRSMSYLFVLDHLLKQSAKGSPKPPSPGLLGHADCLTFHSVQDQEPGWFRRMSFELVVTRDFEALAGYARDVTARLAKKRPEAFKSKIARDVRDAVGWVSIGRLCKVLWRHLARPRVPREHLEAYRQLNLMRNLLVHQHGIVSERYRKASGRDIEVGSQLPVELLDLDWAMTTARNMAVHFDDALVERYGIDTFDERFDGPEWKEYRERAEG
jgi:hypothetical protein